MKLATIGYERATQGAVIATLKDAGVKVVIDVRAVAFSRRAGFSKRLLAASLDEAGIAYVHLPDLGTPKPGRDEARKGHTAAMHTIFNAHMEEPAAQVALAEAARIAGERKSALLCYEADVNQCHRKILADSLAASDGFELEHLSAL